MKQYYYEKLEEATTKLALARIGYEREVKVLASKLLEEDASNHGPIIETLSKIRRAIDAMIEEAKYYKGKYNEECEAEVAQDAEIH